MFPAQRILICFHDFPMGGTERIAIGLAEAWAEAGRDVTILCGSEAGPQRASVDDRITVLQLEPPIPRSSLSRFKLGREMGKRLPLLKPDVIFLPGNFHLLLANKLREADPGPAIVLKISNPPMPHSLGGPVARAVFRYFAQGADALAAMNTGLKIELSQLLPNKLISTRYDPIYTNDADRRMRSQRTDSAALSILWAGRLEPQKDAALALATMKALLQRTSAHLTMLGDGAQRPALKKQIAALGLEEHVTLAGHVPSIGPYLANADALLVTSHYEGGPAVAAEALAHGVPVVGTDCSSFLRDLLTNPQAGTIVKSRNPDSLARALRATIRRGRPDPATLASMVAHLEPRACAQAYLNWFDELVQQRAISADTRGDRAPGRFDIAKPSDNPSPVLSRPRHG